MKKIFVYLALIIGIMGIFVVAPQVSATTAIQEGIEAMRPDGYPSDLVASLKQITNVVLYIVGIIAVIMLIVGGIRYVISGGDSKKVTDAKNTVLYAIIGLVIVFLSWSIVNFFIKALPSTNTESEQSSAATSSILIENKNA